MKNLITIFDLLSFTLRFLFFIFILSSVNAIADSVSIDSVSITEGDSSTKTLTFTVTATNNSNNHTVDYATSDGTATTANSDYVSKSGTVTFSGSDKTETIAITINGDTNVEGNETFTVTLSNPSSGFTDGILNGTGVGTIINDDIAPAETAPVFNGTISNQSEIVGTFYSFDLSTYFSETNGDPITYKDNGNLPTGITINDTTGILSGTPTVAGDYNNIIITATDNDGSTDSNTFNFSVNAASTPSASIADASIAEGDSGTSTLDFTVTLDIVAPAGGVTLDYATSDDTATAGSDYVSSSGTLTIAEGDTNGTIAVTINGDITVETDETFTVTLSNPTNATLGTAIATGTITNDDSSSIVNPIADLCYRDSTGTGNQCSEVNGFYYGPSGNHACLAEVTIENNGSSIITSVEVIKAYDENVNASDDCGIDGTSGNCTLNSSLSGYEPYGGGIVYTLGSMDANITHVLYDEDTYYNGGTVDSITLFGSYTISDANYSGEIPRCSGDGVINIGDFIAHVDIVDDYSYNGSTYTPWIKTKVSKKDGSTFNAVYLGTGDTATNVPQIFAPTYNNPNQSSSITVLGKLVDMSEGTCDTATPIDLFTTIGGNTPVVAIIDAGDTVSVSNSFVMAYSPDQIEALSKRNIRFKYKAIDFNALLDYSGITCAQKSSTGGVVEGIPSCLIANDNVNNPDQQNQAIENYIEIFGQSAYENCYTSNGQPCYASNGGVGAAPYDHDYGCFECSIGEAPYTCSLDNFAIRPDHFDITTTDPDYPNLLRAGEDYNHTVYAYDYGVTSGTVGSLDYNQTGGSGGYLDLNQSRFMATGAADDGTLHGNLVWSAWDFNMTNGISNQNGDLTQTEVAGVQYDDVGKINLRVEDKEWASVDINNPNDPTTHDCSPDGAYLCGDKNVTYIPHHFRFAELNITNHAGPDMNFTYIADNRGMPSATPPTRSPMAARVQTRIEALTKDNNITQNFRAGALYYENNISVTPVVVVTSGMYIYPDANESNITNQLIGFGEGGPNNDANGTRTVNWDESSYPLEFNFRREINQPANPFDVNGSYLSISMLSRYVDADDGDIADINGSRIGDQNGSTTCATDPGCVELNAENNATFYYGRTRPSQYFYDDVTTSSVNTPIAIDIYCDLLFTECSNMDIDTDNAQINEVDWWLSLNHTENSTRHDGNVTLQIGTVTPSGTASISSTTSTDPAQVRITTNGMDPNVTVTATSSDRPMTVNIELIHNMLPFTLPYYTATPPYTNSWLIYNESSLELPSPFYKVRFIGTSGWAGHGDTGHVVDSNVSTKKNRRLEW